MDIKIKTSLIDSVNNNLCKTVFKILHCNLLWIINLHNNSICVLASDTFLLQHYCEKQYYLDDPNINHDLNKNIKLRNKKTLWNITLGTSVDDFYKNGFICDLYRMFHVEEFVSIEKKTRSECYCFRFFTLNNRFVFINKLINNMPIVKCFINVMISKIIFDDNKELLLG